MEPLAAYAFRVWAGKTEFGFSKVSGLARETETFTYQEGGLNDRVHVLRGAVKNADTLRLERGVYAGNDFPFYLVGERLKNTMRIEIWNPANQVRSDKVYLLSGLIVKIWEVGELDALQNAVLIDRFELSYEYFTIVPP